MDYLELLEMHVHLGWQPLKEALPERRFWFLSSKASADLYDVEFRESDVLVFGSEVAGLPPEVSEEVGDRGLRIPMEEPRARCLNLATSVAIALYEQLRQIRR